MEETTKEGKLTRLYHQFTTPKIPSAVDTLFRIVRVPQRGNGLHIKCFSPFVSKIHCEISRRDNAYWIKDLGSTNGTFLNGTKLVAKRERELRFKDIIGIGVSHSDEDEGIDVKDPKYFIFKFDQYQEEVIELSDDENVNSASNLKESESDDLQVVEEIGIFNSPVVKQSLTPASPLTKQSVPCESPDPNPVSVVTTSKHSVLFIPQLPKTTSVAPPASKLSKPVSPIPPLPKKPTSTGLPPSSIQSAAAPPIQIQSPSPSKKSLLPAPPPPRISELPKSSAQTSSSESTGSTRQAPANNKIRTEASKNDNVENIRFNSPLSDISSTSLKSEENSQRKRKLDLDKLPNPGRKRIGSSSDDSSDGLGDVDITRERATKHFTSLSKNGTKLAPASDNEINVKRAFKSSKSNYVNNDIAKETPSENKYMIQAKQLPSKILIYAQQAIVFQNGCFRLTKEVFDAVKPTCKKRMVGDFHQSLKCHKPDIALRSKVETNEEEKIIDVGNQNIKRKSPIVTSESEGEVDSAPSPNSSKRAKLDSNVETSLPENDSPRVDENHDTHGEIYPPQSLESRHKVNTKSILRGIKMIDIAPLPRYAAAAQRKSSNYTTHIRPRDRVIKPNGTCANKFDSPNHDKEPTPTMQQMRNERLRDIERKRQLEKSKVATGPVRQKQPAKVKLTSRSRSEGLMESIIGSEIKNTSDKESVKQTPLPVIPNQNPSPSPLDPRIRNTVNNSVPSNSVIASSSSIAALPMPSTSAVNTAALISFNQYVPCDTNNYTVPARTDPRFKDSTFSTTNSSIQPSHQTNRLKRGAEVILSPPGGLGNVAYKESTSTSSNASLPIHDRLDRKPIFDEEDIYKRMIAWNPLWLKEQENSSTTPPVHQGLTMNNACVQYANFKEYANIYYPFLLSEIWAVISNDLEKAKTPGPNKKKTSCQVKIDKISRSRNFFSDVKGNSTEDEFCNLTYHTWVKTHGEIEPRKDLCVLTLSGKERNTEKDVQKFAISKFNSARYEPIGHNVTCDSRLIPKGASGGFRYTDTIWCRISKHFVVDCNMLAPVKKISYTGAKIREFRAMNNLQSSKLFCHIMVPPTLKKPKPGQKDELVTNDDLISVNRNLNGCQLGITNCVASNVMSDKPELMLLHGPPGTGKTTTIIGLVLQIFNSYQHWCSRLKCKPVSHPRILITTPSNAAIDEIMRRLIDAMKRQPVSSGKKISLIRMGDSVPEEFKEYSLNHRVQEKEEEKSSTKSLQAELASLKIDIDETNREIQEIKSSKGSTITLQAKLSKLQELENKRSSVKRDLNGPGKHKHGHMSTENNNLSVLREANVICSTLSASSSYKMKKVFGKDVHNAEKPFLLCIVDEASQSTELETLLPLTLNIDKVLLVGDPHQLGATVLSNEAAKKDYGWSLFTRLFKYYERPEHRNNSPVMMLNTQYRMHADILKYPNAFFYDNKLETQYRMPLRDFPLRPYLFVHVPSSETSDNEGQIENTDEILIVKSVIETMEDKLARLEKPWTIGVITPYSAQKQGIKDALRKNKRPSAVFPKIQVDTVDGFQGQEKDIIILSCVRTDAIGFLKSANRLNVALTRAKHCLYIIGDSRCLSKDGNWKVLIQDASERNCKYDVNSNFKLDIKMLKNNLINVLAPRR